MIKLCKLEDLKGNEITAKPIITPDYQILLSEGSVIKSEYITKFKDLCIREVYIVDNDEVEETEENVMIKHEIDTNIKDRVKEILEKHMYHQNSELAALHTEASSIIENILSEDKVVEKVFDIKERNADIYEHSVTVCAMSTVLGLKMKYSKEIIHQIGIGCLLHDIGLRYMGHQKYDVPMEEMNEKELVEYIKHPIYGYSALRDEIWLSSLSKNIILSHHEKKNGQGYPLKTKINSKEIEIVIVCDVFDEMICGIGTRRHRVYEAVEYLKTFKNIEFNGKIIDTFLSFTAVYPSGTIVVTNKGEEAIVIKQNKDFPDRPFIKIIKDKDGNECSETKILNLVDSHTIFINEILI